MDIVYAKKNMSFLGHIFHAFAELCDKISRTSCVDRVPACQLELSLSFHVVALLYSSIH